MPVRVYTMVAVQHRRFFWACGYTSAPSVRGFVSAGAGVCRGWEVFWKFRFRFRPDWAQSRECRPVGGFLNLLTNVDVHIGNRCTSCLVTVAFWRALFCNTADATRQLQETRPACRCIAGEEKRGSTGLGHRLASPVASPSGRACSHSGVLKVQSACRCMQARPLHSCAHS